MKNDDDNKFGDTCPSCACGAGKGTWIILALALAVAGVLVAKYANRKTDMAVPPTARDSSAVLPATGNQAEQADQAKMLPRLVDLGADKCIPCKMMAPILEDLEKTYTGKMEVVFIDVWKNPEAGKEYGINVIPTQIFFDAVGKELFRHEGFFGKEDILAKWKELGVELVK